MVCRACQEIPSRPFSRAYLWAPDGHPAAKVAGLLARRRLPVDPRLGEDCLVVAVDDPERFVTEIAGTLLASELRDTKVLVTDGGEVGLQDLRRVTTLRELVDDVRGDWVAELLRDRRYESFVQPIVRLSDGAVLGHEFLLRGRERDGSAVSAAAIFGAARHPRLVAALDRVARINAVRTAKRLGVPGKLFINFAPNAIYEPSHCLRTTVTAVREEGLDPNDVVFEIIESERVDDYAHLRGIVNFYRAAGFQIALDDFGTGYNNLSSLFALRPDFIKLDIVLTRAARDDGPRRNLLGHLIASAASEGIGVIAEGIEDAETLALLRDLGATFGQGYHLGRPSASPAQAATAAVR
jgi:EAL domain-containing protein (putative c-di-GMP-specific phosphodiesterase class I)